MINCCTPAKSELGASHNEGDNKKYMTLKEFFGIHEHKWKVLKAIDVYQEGKKYPVHTKIIQKCSSCGDLKVVIV